MPRYSVYATPGGGERRRRDPIYTFEARDEAAAGEFVVSRLTKQSMELWYGSRLIARFDGLQE